MITRRDVFKELVNPKEVDKSESNKFIFSAIYKGIYMCVRLLLNIRDNQKQIANKLGFELTDKKDT